jgi:3D (Asp-Asp-Asp) domain-containing protein
MKKLIKVFVLVIIGFLITTDIKDLVIDKYKHKKERIYHIVTASCYRAEIGQCDSTPLITADGSIIDTNRVDKLRWIAISRDLNLHYKMGEKVYISGVGKGYDGIWTIRDRMNKRFKKKIDFLISKERKANLFKNVKISKI